MAEPEVRRSGRQRTVSSRLKDMVTSKTARGKLNDSEDCAQDENPKQTKTSEATEGSKTKDLKAIVKNLQTQKTPPSASPKNCEETEQKRNESAQDVNKAECCSIKEGKSKEDSDISDAEVPKSRIADKNIVQNSRTVSRKDASSNSSISPKTNHDSPHKTRGKGIQDEGNDSNAADGKVKIAQAVQLPSPVTKEKSNENDSEIMSEVEGTTWLEIGANKEKKTEDGTAVVEEEVNSRDMAQGDNGDGPQDSVQKVIVPVLKSSVDDIVAMETEPTENSSIVTDEPRNSPADCADGISKAVAMIAASCNLAQYPEARVTQNERGELLLSFNDHEEEEPESPQVRAVVPRLTSSGWECPVEGCHYSTSRRVNWYKHQRVHTGTKAHPCEKCPYVAKTTSNLKRHQMIHTNVKQYVCHFCEDTFRQKIHLKRHIRYKHESKRVQCAYCEYRCANVNPDLRIHMRRRHLIHINEEVARVLCSCKECGFVAPSKKDLAQHMKFHRPGPELKLFCEYCSFVTDCSSRLSRHILIHTKERPYQCGLCDYRASQKQHVVRHMRTKHCVEAEKTSNASRLNKDLDLSALYVMDSSTENNESASESFESVPIEHCESGEKDNELNQRMEVSGALELDVTESVIPPTADMIQDGFRVLMDEGDEKVIEITHTKLNDCGNSLENEKSHASTLAKETIETTVLMCSKDLSKEKLESIDKTPKTSKATVSISTPGTNVFSSSMVSLFQPNEQARDKIYPCTHCTMKFSKSLNLHKHLELQHKLVQPLNCCLCDYKTDRKANLLIHLRKHNMPRKQHRSLISVATPRAKSMLPSGTSKQVTSLLKTTARVYKCVLCGLTYINLQNLYKHIEQKHADILNTSAGQEPGAFCVVQDVPSKTNLNGSQDAEGGFQRVMVEMWPGSPAQPVVIEPPWHQSAAHVTNSSTELMQGLQALANQASNSNVLTASELQAVCDSDNQKFNNIQVPAEQLMNLSSGDYIEIDGEMYKVEFSD